METTKPFLSFKNNKFKFLQFTDLHYGERYDNGSYASWGTEQDINSSKVIENIIKFENPDLIIYSGDLLTSNNIYDNGTSYWNEIMSINMKYNIPWLIIFGNHDDMSEDWNKTNTNHNEWREKLLLYDQNYTLSYSKFGPSNLFGITNYVQYIYNNNTNNNTDDIKLSLIFLDTGGGSLAQKIEFNQVNWLYNQINYLITANSNANANANANANFKNQTSLVEKNNNTSLQTNLTNLHNSTSNNVNFIPILIFQHIPIVQYSLAWNDNDICFGMNQNGGVTPVDTDSGEFEMLQFMQNKYNLYLNGAPIIMNVGHDHGNDYCCRYQNIWLCYGRHSGYGGYGDWTRGARVYEMCLNCTDYKINTWVRLETGDIWANFTVV